MRYASAKTYVNALIDKTGEKMTCMITRGHHGKVDRVLSPCPDSEANPAWMTDKIFLSFFLYGYTECRKSMFFTGWRLRFKRRSQETCFLFLFFKTCFSVRKNRKEDNSPEVDLILFHAV